MKPEVYQRRRSALLHEVQKTSIVPAFNAVQQTNDAAAPFVQEAHFFYLTGIGEPGWVLVIAKTGEEVLFYPGKSDIQRTFEGGLSADEARELSGVNDIRPIADLDSVMKQYGDGGAFGVIGPDKYAEHHDFEPNGAHEAVRDRLETLSLEWVDIRQDLARLRAIKDADELAAIRAAVALTVEAFNHAKQALGGLSYEYELEAEFGYTFRRNGAIHAYDPIVAAGKNACTLHYGKNAMELTENGLVLIDIGARVEGYAADITRTYATGTPSEREVAVHAAVEKAHHEIIQLIRPGYSVKDYHDDADAIMKDALRSLGLLNKPEDYRAYFPHAISHGLGLDVHDSLGAPTAFQPGMVLTVEPGIYIPEEGIGVRIEDDILVTEDGNENLSAALSTAL